MPNYPGRRCIAVLLLLAMAPQAQAAKLVGFVSDSSAPAVAAAAREFHDEHPAHLLVLRTPDQLADHSDAEIVQLWQDADAVLFGAVFGEAAPRLLRLLQTNPPPAGATLFAVSSDRRLTTASRFAGEYPLAELDPETLNALTSQPQAGESLSAHFAALADAHPEQARWLRGRHYWQARGNDNLRGLLAWLLLWETDPEAAPPPIERAAVRYYHAGRMLSEAALEQTLQRDDTAGIVLVIDYDTGDQSGQRDVHDALSDQIQAQGLGCISVFAQWGEASVQAVETLAARLDPASLAGIVTLQDFVVGGGEDRQQAVEAFEKLGVPVLKAVRLNERTEVQWRLSPDGLPWDSVHYRIAMPELQGQSQPIVVAAAQPPQIDRLTGIELRLLHSIDDQISHVAKRLRNWRSLRTRGNADKKIGIIFYNHPPGRHNIGADNLDVVDSLYDLLHALDESGYTLGPLPQSPEELLEMLQDRAVNLPENRQELAAMSQRVTTVPAAQYTRWFATLPEPVRREMVAGPLAALVPQVRQAVESRQIEVASQLIQRRVKDIEHMLEGIEHGSQRRALDLLDQLETAYQALVDGDGDWQAIEQLTAALSRTGIEALSGWGEPPGYIMTHQGELLLPGIRFGNVFVGPQPPRGWELDEELLHANTTFPPPHQYLAFYQWLRDEFAADALVHFGRHSTYEFLPGHRVGLTASDYPTIVAGELPGIYPYIVDGVGEGIQAKRRGLAVMVDHLTPPLRTTPLYDRLLELRQLVETYEAASSGEDETPTQQRIITEIRRLVDELDLTQALVASMHDVLDGRGITFTQVEGHLLVHEVGHYLTKLQEDFMPMGLHVFGRPWTAEAIDTMMESIGPSADSETRSKLTVSPQRELEALLAGLAGQFVAPGNGNDPVRSPEVLPTGRNFHALNSSLIPTKLAWKLGSEMAEQARQGSTEQGSEAIVLWASDTVRDDGAMVAFGLNMLGIEPQWNSRGILQGISRIDLPPGQERHDVVFTTSGLFRDLYQNLLVWLDRAVLLALDGSAETIAAEHPELQEALAAALAPLGELRDPSDEPLASNRVARHWIAAAALDRGVDPVEAGRLAALRVFGDAPGAYGAGVNRLVERSGGWQTRDEIADAYLHRMGHAYGDGVDGQSAHGAFKSALNSVRRTYLGRASNLYGLLDNNDAFDYLGGLNLAVERVSGTAPRNRVVDLSDPDRPSVEPLERAVLAELQGRYLNPAWIKPLMSHGYDGARTMGSQFLENFWGWQVTNPEMISEGMWREIKAVYIDDRHELGLDEFLREGHNAHVRANMLAVMLVAMEKGFWNADPETAQQLAREFAELVAQNGLPGSGHTRPDHPMLDWIEPQLPAELSQRLREIRVAARVTKPAAAADPATLREIHTVQDPSQPEPHSDSPPESQTQPDHTEQPPQADSPLSWGVIVASLLGVLLFTGGLFAGSRGMRRR